MMFYDPHHPTEEVICEKGRRILKILGIRSALDAKAHNTAIAIHSPTFVTLGCLFAKLSFFFIFSLILS